MFIRAAPMAAPLAVSVLIGVCLWNYLGSAEVVDANSASKEGASSDTLRPKAASTEQIQDQEIGKVTNVEGVDYQPRDGPPTDSGRRASAGGKSTERILDA